jgi:ADP-ribose pyrophosphatase
MGEYAVRSSHVTHRGKLSTMRIDAVAMPDGSVADRETVEHDNAVAVVAIVPDGSVVLVRQYRHAVVQRMIEIPAGKLDVDGEAPIDAARRELLEEVGMQADEMVELIHYFNSSGWTDEATTVYLAPDVRPGTAPDSFTAEHEEADLDVVQVPLDQAVRWIDDGEITDGKTVIGLLLAHRHMANDAARFTS